MPPILKIKNLNLRREVEILHAVDWEIQPGEHWVILGANGSGKTTLLNALAAYDSASSGEIELFGETYGSSDWRELRKKIGFVSSSLQARIQGNESALNLVLSGKSAMINYWGEISSGDELRAREILAQMHCEHLANRPWAYLSQGERQRLLIGRALMADYRLLVLDEPCAGLDIVAREKFLKLIQEIATRHSNLTLVLVTHHVEEIMPAFSHVLLLKSGAVLASGTRDRVLRSEKISEAFGEKILVEERGERFSAKMEA